MIVGSAMNAPSSPPVAVLQSLAILAGLAPAATQRGVATRDAAQDAGVSPPDVVVRFVHSDTT